MGFNSGFKGLINIFEAILHIEAHSSIRNLRTRHAVVTETHLSWKYICLDKIEVQSARLGSFN